MKNFVVALFTLTLIGATNAAMAVDNSEISIPKEGKEKGNISEGEKSSKYTFTLFSFFTNEEDNNKSDSVKTKSPAVEPKAKINSNLWPS